MELVAHYTGELPEMKIAPAPRDRPWMPRNAGRCLPLRIANEAGWWVLNPLTFGAVWNDKYTQDAVRLFDSGGVRAKIPHATSLFGNGILTFYLPYLFRTEPGWNLLARGPANHPKHGI